MVYTSQLFPSPKNPRKTSRDGDAGTCGISLVTSAVIQQRDVEDFAPPADPAYNASRYFPLTLFTPISKTLLA